MPNLIDNEARRYPDSIGSATLVEANLTSGVKGTDNKYEVFFPSPLEKNVRLKREFFLTDRPDEFDDTSLIEDPTPTPNDGAAAASEPPSAAQVRHYRSLRLDLSRHDGQKLTCSR